MLLLSMLTWHWPRKQLHLPFEQHGHQAYCFMSAPSTRNTSLSFSPGMVSFQIGCLKTLMNIITVRSDSLWFPDLNHELHIVLLFLLTVSLFFSCIKQPFPHEEHSSYCNFNFRNCFFIMLPKCLFLKILWKFLSFKVWKWKLKFIWTVFYLWGLLIAILKINNEIKYFWKCIIHFPI